MPQTHCLPGARQRARQSPATVAHAYATVPEMLEKTASALYPLRIPATMAVTSSNAAANMPRLTLAYQAQILLALDADSLQHDTDGHATVLHCRGPIRTQHADIEALLLQPHACDLTVADDERTWLQGTFHISLLHLEAEHCVLRLE